MKAKLFLRWNPTFSFFVRTRFPFFALSCVLTLLAAVPLRAEVPWLRGRPAGQLRVADLRPIAAVSTAAPEYLALYEILDAVADAPLPAERAEEVLRTQMDELEAYLQAHPASPYNPAVRETLAEYYGQRLHYQRAMEHWAENLQQLRDRVDAESKAIADRALALLTRHLLIAGQVEEVGPLLAEFQGRVLDEGPLSTMVVRTTQKYRRMLKYPGLSYKCGVFALDRLAQSQGWTYDRRKLRSAPSGPEGLSLLDLQKLANEFRLPVLPVRAVDAGVLPVPAVMHSTQGHYVTLLKERAGQVLVHDPGAKRETWVPLEDVAEEASGCFLTPGLQAPAGTAPLDTVAAGQIRGRTTSCPPDYSDDFDCDSEDDVEWNDGGERAAGGEPESCSLCEEEEASCCGAAAAVVRPQFLGLWIKDRPVVYRPSKGPMIYPKIRFKRYSENFEGPSVFGGNWRLAYHMGVWESESLATVLYKGGRAAAAFDEDGSGGYLPVSQPLRHDGAVLVKPQGGQPWTLKLATGRQIEFGAYVPGIGLAPTKLINRFGHALQLFYDANGRLFRLTDADGKDTYLYYATFFGQTRLHRIVTPDNRQVVFGYVQTEAGNVLLASITDATGLVSTFTYPGSQSPNLPFAPGVPETITTPYGTTSFDYASGQDNFDDFVIVTDPTGAKRAYAMNTFTACAPAFEAWQLPVGAPDPNTGLPGTSTIDTVWREWNNTYYWSPKATAALFASTNSNPNNWCWTELKQARIFGWLSDPDNWDHVTDMPNYIQEPSPDGGQTEGQVTFFDYPGKPPGSNSYPGTSRWPSVTTRRLPNGETWWAYHPHNPQGRVLQRKETYTQTNGVVGVRTRATYTYSADGLDLLEERDGSNNLRRSYTWDANHRLLTKREYFGPGPSDYYQTSFTYNPTYGLPATRTDPTGLVTTWTYTPAGGGANGYTVTKTTSPVASTETEVWSNGRRVSHTDALGFTRNFTYDALDRVTRIDYPSDGTYELFVYVRDSDGAPLLDLDTHRNRLGGLTHYEYDGARRVKSVTDPRGKTTTYTYCPCGDLERITDPVGNQTEFTYDQAGRRKTLTVKRPDNTVDAWASYDYNPLGQLTTETVTINGQNSVRAFTYNHQGLRVSTSVGGRLTEKIVFDAEDRPWQVTDRNGVTLTHTYDWLGRRTRTDYPDGGWEEFDYSARGLTQRRRRINATFIAVTSYGYDEARRKISETTPKNETLSYTYDAAGNLRTLTDGRAKTTTWTYDAEGRLWKKKYHGQSFDQIVYGYDANGRLTSRRFYSSATSYRETLYGYDANGNLTTVNYPAPTADLSFVYDDANRLTQMTDAYGTTSFTYNAAGALLTENGPLTGTPDPDLLTYSYANNSAGLRTSLTLNQPGGGTFSVSYSYDLSRRLYSVSSPAGAFSYTYQAVSVGGQNYAAGLVQQLSLPGSLKIVNDFTDPRARLIQTEFKDAANVVKNSHAYAYNYGGQRTSHTRGGNGHSYAGTSSFSYDNDGQLSSSSLESLSYGYDAGWNLTSRSGTSYTVNDRNQVTAEGGLTYAYDANGNRTFKYWNAPSYTSWAYTYDDENQLLSVATDTSYTPEASRWKTEFVYDGRQRLRLVKHYTWQYGGWYGPVSQVRYLYDGLLVIQERNPTVPTVSYTRGLDLSGSLAGAGGIGGLLARSRHGTSSPYGISGTSYYHADGNGNITYLASSRGSADAAYRYDPFGRWLAHTGAYAAANGMRFSSKPWLGHNGSNTDGLYYYGYRFYEPLTQRWLNRDPIFENGGINLYAFALNAAVNFADPMGLFILDEDGFPIDGSYDGFGSYLYDRETKDAHDRMMDEGTDTIKDAAKEAGKELLWIACPLGRFGNAGKAAKGFLGKGGPVFGRGKKGILNSNDFLRIGWGWKGPAIGGRDVFRIAWGSKRSRFHGHIIIWPPWENFK